MYLNSSKRENNIYQKFSIYLQKRYLKKKKEKCCNIKNNLLSAYNNLKQINSFYLKSQKELDKYKITTSFSFIEEDELINTFYLFAPLIGLIDKQIEIKNTIININMSFLDLKSDSDTIYIERIIENQDELKTLLSNRELILSILKNYEYRYNKNNLILQELLSIQPSYINFNNLYNENNNYIVELITAYNLGYTCCNENIYSELFELFKILTNNLRNNNNKVLKKV